jgi:predicted nucleotidyltransferase
MTRSRKPVKPEIQRMVDVIVRRFQPERIILFGSHARGAAGHDSDVDLLVVMPLSDSKSDVALEIRAALRRFRVPKDIVVSAPEEFAWRKDVVGTIEYPAVREGKTLYARP